MDEMLFELQLTQIEMLKVFDQICQNNHLRYSLYGGSLLGAVRHKGFIPWDDDLDVCMPRQDYETFIQIWDKTAPNGYILQNKDIEPEFTQSFSKIRKKNTTFLQDKKERGKYHTGIFIDVFPLDRIPNGKIKRMCFQWNCMKYQLFTREFIPPKENKLLRLGSWVVLQCTPQKKRTQKRKQLEKKLTQYNGDTTLQIVGIETMQMLKQPFDKHMLDSYVKLHFENGEFMCFADWDGYLKRQYGDYMQLPPEEERTWKHHPVVIDFEHEEINEPKIMEALVCEK